MDILCICYAYIILYVMNWTRFLLIAFTSKPEWARYDLSICQYSTSDNNSNTKMAEKQENFTRNVYH